MASNNVFDRTCYCSLQRTHMYVGMGVWMEDN